VGGGPHLSPDVLRGASGRAQLMPTPAKPHEESLETFLKKKSGKIKA